MLSGSGLRVAGFELRVACCELRAKGHRAKGIAHRVRHRLIQKSDYRCRKSIVGTGHKAYGIGSKLEGIELIDLFRIPHFEFRFLSSDFPIPLSEFQFLSSVICLLKSCTLYFKVDEKALLQRRRAFFRSEHKF